MVLPADDRAPSSPPGAQPAAQALPGGRRAGRAPGRQDHADRRLDTRPAARGWRFDLEDPPERARLADPIWNGGSCSCALFSNGTCRCSGSTWRRTACGASGPCSRTTTGSSGTLRSLAARSASPIPGYLDKLTDALVVRQLKPWHENIGKRQVRSPKVYVRDSGLMHALLNLPTQRDLENHPKAGASWEGFILGWWNGDAADLVSKSSSAPRLRLRRRCGSPWTICGSPP